MESHAIDMRNSVFGHAFALAVLAVACAGALRADSSAPATGHEFRFDLLASHLARRYGVWMVKGPRVVSDSGEPLLAASAVEVDRYGRTAFALPLDEDGRIVLGSYVNDDTGVRISCEGYYSRQVSLSHRCEETEIVLRRKRRPHPMLSRKIDVTLPMSATNAAIQVDLGPAMPLAVQADGKGS